MLTANDQFTWDYAFASIATAFFFFCCCCCDLKKTGAYFFPLNIFWFIHSEEFFICQFFILVYMIYLTRGYLKCACVCIHVTLVSALASINVETLQSSRAYALSYCYWQWQRQRFSLFCAYFRFFISSVSVCVILSLWLFVVLSNNVVEFIKLT